MCVSVLASPLCSSTVAANAHNVFTLVNSLLRTRGDVLLSLSPQLCSGFFFFFSFLVNTEMRKQAIQCECYVQNKSRSHRYQQQWDKGHALKKKKKSR